MKPEAEPLGYMQEVSMGFHGFKWISMFFYGSRSVFYGSRSVFHGFARFQVGFSWFQVGFYSSRSVFHGSRWVFHGSCKALPAIGRLWPSDSDDEMWQSWL